MFLGTGTSHGVPLIGCGCETCTSQNPKNSRTRCAAVLGLPEGNLLVDTPPELRIQLIRERIGLIDAVLYTHAHADHLFGLDDLRIFPHYLGHELPIYCEKEVEYQEFRERSPLLLTGDGAANLHEARVVEIEAARSRLMLELTQTQARLDGICDLAEKYDSLVMIDDSHATGFIGKTGRGTHEYRGVMGFLQFFLEISHVGMFKDVPLGLAQSNAVNDGGMVQCIGDNGIFGFEQGFEQAAIGIKTG